MEENETIVDGVSPFSAVLLAGGKSSRMGFDKAMLLVDGEMLWQRQMRLLDSLGAEKVFISGPANGPWKDQGVAVIEDEVTNQGPMGALVSILRKIATERVLVLAVDMPAMSASFLARLLEKKRAIVPKISGFYEPLAAVYEKSALELFEDCLSKNERKLQNALRSLVEAGAMIEYPVGEMERPYFANVNHLEKY